MSLVATLLERIQPNYAGQFDKNEIRRSGFGALGTFIQDTDVGNSIISPDDKLRIMESFGRKGGVVIPALNAKAVTIGNVRSCTILIDENTSTEFTLNFTTYAWGFTMHRAQYVHNTVGYVADFDRKMRRYMIQLLKDIENQCISTLEADKNQFYPTQVTDIFPVLANALRVPAVDANDAYNNIATIANIQDFEGDFNVIANQIHKPLISRLTNQGQANDVNEAFQFGPYDYAYTNRVLNGVGVNSTSYVAPKGNLAIMNRNDWDSKLNHKSTDGRQWAEVELPMSVPMSGSPNMKVGSLFFSSCENAVTELGTALGGHSEASLKEAFIFNTDVVTLSAFNSNRVTNASPIQKYEFLA